MKLDETDKFYASYYQSNIIFLGPSVLNQG